MSRPAPLALLLLLPIAATGQAARRTPAPRTIPMMASADSSFFRGLSYRLVGPSRGGRVTTVTGVPSQPRTFYMGVASGGVFRTTDGGENWTPITDGEVPVGSTGSIAVAESNPDVIYLGTGSDGVRSNVSTGRGVYRSVDGGRHWRFAGLYDVGQIGAVRIHPSNPDIAWVSAMGDAFKPSPARGIYKTTDGGKSWRKTLSVSDSTGAMDVELQPGHPEVVYAWMSRLERKPWTIISGSREGGFYKSTDGGEHWSHDATGLPHELIGKGNLAVTAANPDRIYALIEAKPGGGLYRSDDAGRSWALVNSTPGLITRPFYYTTLGADPTNADVVYAGAESFYKSVDGGKTMTGMRVPHGDNHDIWISPKDGNIMIESNDGGAVVSFDGGKSWSSQDNQPTAEIYGIWMDDQFPYRIYGAQQDASTIILSSIANPFNLGDWRSGPGCETGPIMPHPRDPQIVYGSCKGQYEVMDLRSGLSKNYWVGGQSLYGNPASDLIYRMQRVSPMATSPHNPDVLYYGSQYLHRTTDQGVTWERISPDLTAHPACCQGVSGEPITRDVTGEEFYSTLYAITEAATEPGVIWTGSNDGPFHVTRDNGKSWTDVTPKDLPPGGRVAWIDASPHRKGSAYFAVYRYLLGDYQPYLYRTNDYGRTWKRLTDGTNGIPADSPTRVVREDPAREGLLYAGTEFGIFLSYDDGAHWQPFQLNLPNVPINDIRVHHGDLIVATQGRSIWILDDLSALRQLTPGTKASEIQLFHPRDGYRTRTGASLLGPAVRYYLPAAVDGEVKLEIRDSAGTLVNSYNSTAPVGGGGRGGRGGGAAPAAATDADAPPVFTGRGGGVAARPTRNAGMNRFTWDVRNSSGITAPPGRYQARLIVGSVVKTVPFVVRIDPRVAATGVTVADLREEFAHNMRMRTLMSDVGALVTRVNAAATRLRGASGAAADTLARVEAIAAQLNTEPVRYGKPGLQAQVSYLASMTSNTDQKVGRDALARYGVLLREFEVIRRDVDRLLGTIAGGPAM